MMLQEFISRRSVRKYQDRAVPRELLYDLLESARLAPSGGNTQPWNFILVTDDQTRQRLAQVDHDQHWMLRAPVFLVCTADLGCRLPNSGLTVDETSPQPELKQVIRDTSIAIEHILLEAERLGLGTCWTGWYRQADVREILHIPADQYVCGIVCVGYPAETPDPRPRRALQDMVYEEIWGNPVQQRLENDET